MGVGDGVVDQVEGEVGAAPQDGRVALHPVEDGVELDDRSTWTVTSASAVRKACSSWSPTSSPAGWLAGEPVEHDEVGPRVVLELGALVGVGRVLEGERVEAEPGGEPVEVLRLGRAVHPDGGSPARRAPALRS